MNYDFDNPDFRQFLLNSIRFRKGTKDPKRTVNDYITRLKALVKLGYSIDNSLDSTKVKEILDDVQSKAGLPGGYQKRSIGDFPSTLWKYIDFLNQEKEEDVEKTIVSTTLETPYKTSIIKARRGQGVFRDRIVAHWNGKCAISGCDQRELLIASHIKPWRDCQLRADNKHEHLDENNGLLLLPNYDKLFDLGYISFQNNGKIIISPLLKKPIDFSIKPSLCINGLNDSQLSFMEYHRETVFKGR